MKRNKRAVGSILLAALILSSTSLYSCAVSSDAKNHVFRDFDVKAHVGIEFPSEAFDFGELGAAITPIVNSEPNCILTDSEAFPMTVIDKMDIYQTRTAQYPYNTLNKGERIYLVEPAEGSVWATVYSTGGVLLGYAKDGFLHAVNSGSTLYAEVPIETGLAPDSTGRKINAYSHLVDIRKYLKVYESTNISNAGVDLSRYDIKVSMKLSTNETSIGEPFYDRNLCLIQYDTLQKLVKAIEIFKNDGYTIVIYDAYRPTSVQQRWFDVVRVHKWVADPSRGMGGIHDRGTALDISLIDSDGNEIEMPTPMHTFTNDSARSSENMTDTARDNMNYMTDVMTSCGFTYINSEWWHFQCANTRNYLPTDHPLDTIPLVPSENELVR